MAILTFSSGGLSLQLRIVQETSCFVSSYDPVENRRIIASTTDQVTINRYAIITLIMRWGTWHTVLCSTKHFQVTSHNSLARTMANRYRCCEVVYRLGAVGTHQHCNLFNRALSSNRLWLTSTNIILQIVSPLRKTSLPPKRNTATQCVVTVNFETFR